MHMIRNTLVICLGLGLVGIVLNYQRRMHAHVETLPSTHEITNHGITHLSLIMDGNRRWAREQGLNPWEGHKAALQPLKMTLEFCLNNNIPYVSAWVFAIQNFKRPAQELKYLFSIAENIADKELQELYDKGIKITFIGDRSKFPENLRPLIEQLERKTAHHTKLNLIFLFCYSGREEIADTCKRIVQEVQAGNLTDEQITQQLFESKLWTAGIPDPDLVIRTGKDNYRLSNFMQYQCAYSELYFIKKYWPEIQESDLVNAVTFFMNVKRNFGA